MKGYEYLARLLKANGTTHIFYQELMFMKTVKEFENLGLTTIMAHSEFAAGYMADGYARISLRPGVCLSQSIGSANLAASIHDAWLGSTPVIAFTGKKTPFFQERNSYQESNHMPFFDGVTKYNAEIAAPDQLPHLVRQAYREAVTGKPRPVHLDVYGFFGLETEQAEMTENFVANPEFANFPAFRPAAEPKLVKKAAAELDGAKKPVLLLGRGALISGAGDRLRQLAEESDMWIITTPDGKTAIDENHRLWGGIVGGYGMDSANKLAAAADLVIMVGTQTSDQATLNWTAPRPSTRVIQIDIDPTELGRSYPNCIGLFGDAATVADQLLETVTGKKRSDWISEGQKFVDKTLNLHRRLWELNDRPIRSERLCHEVSRALPDDAIVVADTGWSAVWSATMIRMKSSQMYTRAAGSLGWSFPASLGAKCAAPDRPVINFIGDGAFFYLNTEMETAARRNIKTVTVINNNNSLSQCIPFAQAHYPGEQDRCSDRFTFSSPNLAKIAESYGLWAKRVDRAEDIAPALAEALAADKPALVEVLTDHDQPGPPSAWEE